MSSDRVTRERFAEIVSDALDKVQLASPFPQIDPPKEFQRLWDDALDRLDKAEEVLQEIVDALEEDGDE